jgi:hypothetical protein
MSMGTAVILSALVLFTQCSSNRWAVSSKNIAPDREDYEITMSMTYLTEDDLLTKFTNRNNPYIPPKTLVTGTDMIVFEVMVQNNTPGRLIIVPYESMRLIAGERAFVPISAFRLTDFWEDVLKGRNAPRDYNATPGKMGYVIRETLWENPAEVQPGDSYSGIIAFMGNFSKYGWGEINIPVFDGAGKVIGIFGEEFERY